MQNKALPLDIRLWPGRRDACTGRKPLTPPPGMHMDTQEIRACDPAQAGRAREELLKRFEGDGNAIASLR